MAASVVVMFSLVPNATFGGTPSGQTYQAVPLAGTTYGVITNINPIDVTFLGGLGCQDRIPFNNYNAARAPLATDDYTVGYNTGSLWAYVQGTFSVLYECTAMGSTPGSATWVAVTGPTGATGPQGPTGPAGITWRGTYSSVTTYAQGDGVSDAGNAYVSLQSGNLNNTPTSSPSFWTEVGLTPAAGNATLDIWAIGGQSNAEGQSGDPALSPTVPVGVYQYNGSAIVAGNDPVGNASPSSAWPAFGIEYLRSTGRPICFVPSAVGGTDQCATTGASTQNWDITSQGSWGSTDTLAPALIANVAAAVIAAANAGWNPVFRGILWAQGENDAGAVSNNALRPITPPTVAASYGPGSNVIAVSSGTNLAPGQFAVISLNAGSTFTSEITGVSGTTITLATGVPAGQLISSGASFHVFTEDDYLAGFERMANYFRTTAINGVTYSELPIFISQLGAPSTGDVLGWQRVRQAQDRICARDPYTKIAFRGAVDFPVRGIMQNAAATYTASIAGTTMTVSGVSAGTVLPFADISGAGVASNSFINQSAYAAHGGVGGPGQYTVSPSQTVASTTITQGPAVSPHYKQEAYNLMGREMAKGVVGARDGFVPQGYNVQRLAIGGTLTPGDTLTLTATSSAITGSPWTMGPVSIASGTTFTTFAQNIVLDATYFSPNLSAAGIFADYQITPWGVYVTFYQPKSLSPQMVLTASWTGSGSELWSITSGEAAYGQAPDVALSFGPTTINFIADGSIVVGPTTSSPSALGQGNMSLSGFFEVGGLLGVESGTALPAGGNNIQGIFLFEGALGIFAGSGVPTLAAPQGSLYLRSDGNSTSTRIYVATNGTGGWTNMTTAS